MRSRSALGSRSVERAPPRAAADEPCRRARPCGRSGSRAPAGRAAVSSERRRARAAASARCRPPRGTRATPTSSAGGRRPRTRAAAAASRQAPGAPAVRPQPFGNGATREPGKLSELSNSELLPAPRSARRSSGSSVERQRREELSACARRATTSTCPGRATRGRGERGEPALGRARRARPSAAPTAASARLQRRLEPAVEPLDTARLEVGDARARPARPRSPHPRAGGAISSHACSAAGRVRVDEHERGQVASASPSRIPGRTPAASAAAVTGPEKRLLPAAGASAAGAQRSAGRRAQRRLQLEPGDDEAGDHGNVCSTRTHVLLSSREVARGSAGAVPG